MLPTWEIVIITVICVTVCAAAIYVFIRCWDSIKAVAKESPRRTSTQQQARKPQWAANQGFTATEVYGVPYRAPDEKPKQLDPATLESMVMGGKSDLHPYYLEKKDHVIEPERDDTHRDQRVTWRPDEILIDSEFLPSMTDLYNRSLSSEGSPRPKRKVHIDYSKALDGSPEIKSITTEASSEDPVFDESVEETAVTKSQCETTSSTGNEHVAEAQQKPTQEKRVLSVPHETWVEFEQAENSLDFSNETKS